MQAAASITLHAAQQKRSFIACHAAHSPASVAGPGCRVRRSIVEGGLLAAATSRINAGSAAPTAATAPAAATVAPAETA